MICYRLYTENVEGASEKVVRCLEKHGFSGATLQGGIGVWQGDTEKSLVVEIQTDGDYQGPISELAESIRRELNQWTVKVIAFHCESWNVEGGKRDPSNGKEVIA